VYRAAGQYSSTLLLSPLPMRTCITAAGVRMTTHRLSGSSCGGGASQLHTGALIINSRAMVQLYMSRCGNNTVCDDNPGPPVALTIASPPHALMSSMRVKMGDHPPTLDWP
jgi:hypothetical protein